MKTNPKHALILFIALASAGTLPTHADVSGADALPVSSHEDGTGTELSDEDIDVLVEWGAKSYQRLKDLLESTSYLLPADALIATRAGLLEVFPDGSELKRTEITMRHAINRTIKLVDKIAQHPRGLRPTTDARLRLMRSTVSLSVGQYKSDIAYLNMLRAGGTPQPVASADFGLQYAKMAIQNAQQLLNVRARYNVTYMTLDWLKKDLVEDKLVNQIYAPETGRLKQLLEMLPQDVTDLRGPGQISDEALVNYLSQMMQLYNSIVGRIEEIKAKAKK